MGPNRHIHAGHNNFGIDCKLCGHCILGIRIFNIINRSINMNGKVKILFKSPMNFSNGEQLIGVIGHIYKGNDASEKYNIHIQIDGSIYNFKRENIQSIEQTKEKPDFITAGKKVENLFKK